jgi:hypothetical protein
MRCELAGRCRAAGGASALLVFVLLALALAACRSGEERKATPTPAPMGTLLPTASTAAAATSHPTPTPVPTPSWQTSEPDFPVPAGNAITLGIRNENGRPGETHAIGAQVNLPDGSPVNMEGEVVGDGWTYFPFEEATLPGTYTVYFGVPGGDVIYAEASFEVYLTSPTPGYYTVLSWETSAPRTPVAVGEAVELGLRNQLGEPGECYDFVIELFDPMGDYAASAQDSVCGDAWTKFTYDQTFMAGIYAFYFAIEGQLIADDSFEVVRSPGGISTHGLTPLPR